MFKFYLGILLCFLGIQNAFAQDLDEITLHLILDQETQTIQVSQKFKLYNRSNQDLNEIYFHSWVNAYSGKLTELNRIKLQDRKGALHFSEKENRGGIQIFTFASDAVDSLSYHLKEREFVQVNLNETWKKGEWINLYAEYEIKIPFNKVTQYGFNDKGEYLLKYFFLQPATQDEKGNWVLEHYKDFEELVANPSKFTLTMNQLYGYSMLSDLKEYSRIWKSEDIGHFRIYLTPHSENLHIYEEGDTRIEFGYGYDSVQKPIIDSLLPHQLKYLESHLGELPTKKLFISAKTKKEQDYFGVDDLDAWIMDIKLFSEQEKNALKLFQALSYEYIDRLFVARKNEDHWLKNGLQIYLMMKYVDQNFPEMKLLGQVPEKLKILGMKPLKFFHASKLNMNDRYKLLYLYLARQNYDQPINTPFDEMSNLNQFAISGFKTGLTFYYIDQYLGGNQLDDLIKAYAVQNRGKIISQEGLQRFFQQNSTIDSNWFFDDYIDRKDKINFKLLSAKETGDSLKIKVKNQTKFQGAFKIVASKDKVPVAEQWYKSAEKYSEVNFPAGDYDKLEINPGYLFPEFNDRDNFLRTKGLFKNGKKLQFKLYSDIENPEYSQIFMNPQIRWNNYDKFLIGIRFHNQSLLTRPFKWNVSPKLSTGTGKLTGSAGVSHTFTPQRSIFRSILIGGAGKFEHYDEDLTYTKWSLYTTVHFKKDPRESLSHGFLFSYDNLDKEVPKFEVQTDEDKYGLWNLTYFYSRPDYIHESHGSVTLQTTKTFQKVIGEIYYRWRFAPKKQLGVRLFAGSFVTNESDSDYFNFGVNQVSDYAFNMNLLGRSESSGVLSQQFVLAEAGFKSPFDFTVNQWIVSTNFELPIWKMFDLYTDAGVYKNKFHSAKFLYDSGIKVKVIPDFLEFYFPIQSSLGFEPAKDKYWERIRFTFNFNLSSIINHLRRGWY